MPSVLFRLGSLQFYAQPKGHPYQHSGEIDYVTNFQYVEPVGSAAPKVNLKLKAIESSLGEKLDLVCPAQGMPIPTFR